MSLRNIPYKSLYIVPKDNYVEEVLISSLKKSASLDCMFGFFGSAALRSIAPGLSEYLGQNSQPMRLVVSPNIGSVDLIALQEGIATPSSIMESRLEQLLGEAKISTSALVQHTLTCLAYMLATKRLLFRVIWLKDGSLFHPKVWFFRDNDDTVVAHGSSNFTDAGIGKNLEQISVDMSWLGGRSKETIDTLSDEFNALWEGSRDYAYTLDLPIAIENQLIRDYKPDCQPTSEDFCKAWEKDVLIIEKLVKANLFFDKGTPTRLAIPSRLDLFNGPFSHQGKAINAWEAAKRRGFLSMATGSGKTITALAAASRLQSDVESLLVIISAPYKPLVYQWVNEVNAFGVRPLPTEGPSSDRAQHLDFAVRSLKSKVSKIEVMVVTENFLTSETFRRVLDRIPENISTLLIADEAHNLGKISFLSNTPDRFNFRLGLSATPERQYDPEGTSALFDFFGVPVFEFGLSEAIGVCLVPYNYYIHQVHLTRDEYEEWMKLTERLARKGIKGDADASESGGLSKVVEKLLFARRRVIESAENKVDVLRNILKKRTRDNLKHVLVYATDKNPSQLNSVNDMLQNDLNLTIHQLTSAETMNRTRSANLLERFANGDYNAITCKRVLDEGVDVPQVSEAYLLASNTVRRQWIQRRGRILRKCDAINKQLAHLHDFIVVPPDLRNKGSRTILKGELERAREFAELSSNGGRPDGPFDEIEKLMTAMFS
ncbi:DEAD/DEAH box helicase family protein [Gimesia fumaroli]|uniref:Type I restriction enzyme EcoKI subunit R n=1 Tax=Gimesia fumaroli TaxID=2527976 RepID=A0A518I5X6_9PLAN|nr:DEAD/DEAH box helicase family protein [Gimesia fumaroli]QDV48459.1 type I restriction enzyme EcoKI subunit R [Gimesia fumaroli]